MRALIQISSKFNLRDYLKTEKGSMYRKVDRMGKGGYHGTMSPYIYVLHYRVVSGKKNERLG